MALDTQNIIHIYIPVLPVSFPSHPGTGSPPSRLKHTKLPYMKSVHYKCKWHIIFDGMDKKDIQNFLLEIIVINQVIY